MTDSRQVQIAGIGSPHGDDQAGWEMVRALQQRGFPQAQFHLARTPDDLLNWLDSGQTLVVCDACRGAGEVGSVHRWQWPTAELKQMSWSGTHQISLPGVLSLAEQLGQLPAQVVVWGVEVSEMSPGEVISRVVLEGIAQAVESICREWAVAESVEVDHA
ncbi:Hydrogenase maturation protease [Gimesia panareensis]|uniref:Hydrogenase maturation protease n=1 Tax=Gimesia panareensis TaxID=2527978 RepID=A0A518FSH9_9PLAN|nr:hydrogenase maturation protease [Gimesia panareensis]QDV19297.1 Hydrogenase maturation protease [Gimesia panareensis]